MSGNICPGSEEQDTDIFRDHDSACLNPCLESAAQLPESDPDGGSKAVHLETKPLIRVPYRSGLWATSSSQ